MQWTDRVRQVKMVLLAAAVVIAVASLLVSHVLVRDLSKEERYNMEVWAQALRALSTADENTDLSLVLKVIQGNNTIPVIVLDADGNVMDFRNIEIKADNRADSTACVARMADAWHRSGTFIKIASSDTTAANDYQLVCYDDSLMLKRLASYPYIQLTVVLIFVLVAVFALLSSKRAEQNRVWVGLSKETAHQLGTPISSLMAWTEILKEAYPGDTLIPDMEADVKRLQLIADRFSKIGSQPEPVETSLNEVTDHVISYMDRRTSKSIVLTKHAPETDIVVKICPQLFEWVIENLCKNAVDAMAGANGAIEINVAEQRGMAVVEVSDTGKGIRKKDLANVFRPGFTTKKRGWGLGLSLAKRIIEDYHHGKIFVKSSELGVGTTFRIELRK